MPEEFQPGFHGTVAEEEPEPTFLCPQCEEEYDSESDAERCCWPSCPICGERHEDQHDADHCCQTPCDECGELYEYQDDAYRCCRYRCESCGEYYDYESEAEDCCGRGGDPYYPTLAAVTAYLVNVEHLDNRVPRLLSIEQELTAGGAAVARMLYDIGLGESPGIEDYSYSPNPTGIAVCEDGSLPSDGGEVKYSMFDLSRGNHVTKLSEALTKIRQLHKDAGIVSVSTSAGMHIHAAAKDVLGRVLEPVGMTALHELFSFGEDMIYGLAAAGWTRHRYSGEGNDYAKPIPKVAQQGKTPWKVAAVMGSKYYGINFERLLNTVNRCQCGCVRYGAWSECQCGSFDRATVEWRVFNTSTKPETIHAWLLFVAATMELAHSHEVGTLSDQPFRPSGATAPERMERRWETLEWFLGRAPLTPAERDVIRGTASRSPLFSTRTTQD